MNRSFSFILILLLSISLALSCEQPTGNPDKSQNHTTDTTDDLGTDSPQIPDTGSDDSYVDIPGVPYIPKGISGDETMKGIIKDPKLKDVYIRASELKPDDPEISMFEIAMNMPRKDYSQLSEAEIATLSEDAIAWIKQEYALVDDVTVEITKDDSAGTFEIVAYTEDKKNKFRWYQFSDQTWTTAYDFWPSGQVITMRVQQFMDSRSWYPRILNTGSLIGNMMKLYPLLENVAEVICLVESDLEENIVRDEYWMTYKTPDSNTMETIMDFYNIDKLDETKNNALTTFKEGNKEYHTEIELLENGDLRVVLIWEAEYIQQLWPNP